MKFFWLLVGVVVIAAGTMVFAGRAVRSAPTTSASSTAAPVVAKATEDATPRAAEVSGDASPANPGATDHIVAPAKETPLQAPAGAAVSVPSKTEAVAVEPPKPAPPPAKAEPAMEVEAKAESKPERKSETTPDRTPDAAAGDAGAVGGHAAHDSLVDAIAADAMPRTPDGDVIVRHDDAIKIVKKSTGEMIVDDRYALKGDGSDATPYEITWEYLLSAQETYDPKKGKKKVPERLAMLDGKQVRITGYIAFPLMAQSPKELLAMLNQWDGCCIGVPPTPYDAIEVRLDKAATQEEKFTNYGSVQGVFKVTPYVVGEWLVGLYVMNEAKLASKNSRVGT